MVDLEPIPAEADLLEKLEHQANDLESHGVVDLMHDMTRQDAQRLKTLIEKHRRYTGSEKAKRILDNWSTYLPKFIKVMPVDYRQALEKMQKAQEQGHSKH